MNRIPGTVAPNPNGFIDTAAGLLRVEAARGHAGGEQVMLLVRPETIDIAPLHNAIAPLGGLVGRVVSHTFLGSVTRVAIASSVGDIKVDVGSTQALSLAMGTEVALTWDPGAPRLIGLTGTNKSITHTHLEGVGTMDTQQPEPASERRAG